jgi:ankyrin repeat protein
MSQRKKGLFDDHDDLEFKIVKMLLASGANLNIKSKDGKSPFTIAFENGMTDLLKIFGGNVDLN